MTKAKRSITLSTELDEAIAKLSISKNMNYSEFIESRLRQNPTIEQMIRHLEDLPEMPVLENNKNTAAETVAATAEDLSKQLESLKEQLKRTDGQKSRQRQLLRA